LNVLNKNKISTVYFADMSSKSANYAHASKSNPTVRPFFFKATNN